MSSISRVRLVDCTLVGNYLKKKHKIRDVFLLYARNAKGRNCFYHFFVRTYNNYPQIRAVDVTSLAACETCVENNAKISLTSAARIAIISYTNRRLETSRLSSSVSCHCSFLSYRRNAATFSRVSANVYRIDTIIRNVRKTDLHPSRTVYDDVVYIGRLENDFLTFSFMFS